MFDLHVADVGDGSSAAMMRPHGNRPGLIIVCGSASGVPRRSQVWSALSIYLFQGPPASPVVARPCKASPLHDPRNVRAAS